MKTVKTAISIDTTVFRSVERLTRRLHISRSQFFTQAARHMIEKDDNLDLLRKINAAYDKLEPDDAALLLRKTKEYARRKVADVW